MAAVDGTGGMYQSESKKPVGGHIMAHASTTRLAITFKIYMNVNLDFRFENRRATSESARFTIHHVCRKMKQSLQSLLLELTIRRTKKRIRRKATTRISFDIIACILHRNCDFKQLNY